VLRERSLAFFKKFFSDPQNTYLKGSLLAEYTLEQ
jgi:tRNA(adenine34) deaminase